MKVPLCVSLIMLACTATLYAQDAVPDTVATEEEYQYIEKSEDDTSGEDDDDYAEDDTPSVTHELVSPEKLPTTRDHAHEKMDIRKFDDKQWKEVIGNTTFRETPEKVKEEDEKEKDDDSTRSMPSLPWDGASLRIVAYIIVIALIIGAVYLFTKDIRFKVKVKASEVPEADLTAPVENIEHIEISTPLQKALSDANFKLATRLYFLDLLKRLNETGLISWKKNKTNRDYLMELYSKEFHFEAVRKLTLAYELVWYGEHTLSNEAYQKLFSEFETMLQKINTPAAA